MNADRPTPEAIAAEVSALQAMQPNVRKLTFFGDNNHDAMRSQVIVLTERLSVDDVYRAYGQDEPSGDAEFTDHILNSALAAAEWLRGNDPELPSATWVGLVMPQGVSAFIQAPAHQLPMGNLSCANHGIQYENYRKVISSTGHSATR